MGDKTIHFEIRNPRLVHLINQYKSNTNMKNVEIAETAFDFFFNDKKSQLLGMSKEQLIDIIMKLETEKGEI